MFKSFNKLALTQLATISLLASIAQTCLRPEASAQTFPLSQNSWKNPEFVERFMGSYGVKTEIEPQVTPEEAELFKQMAELLRNGQNAEATTLLRTAITPESSAALDYTLGSLLLQNGNHSGALAQYAIAIGKFPNFLRAYKNSGLAQIQAQNFEKGIEFLIKAIELGDGGGDNYGLLAYCYLNTGQFQSALNAYRVASVLAPGNRDWALGMATALQQTGHYREALAKFRELITAQPNNENLYLASANAHLALQEEKTSAAFLEILRRMGKAETSALMLLGDIYINDNLPSLALPVYQDALNKGDTPDHKRMLRFLRALVQRAAYTEATDFIAAFRKALPSTAEPTIEDDLLNLESQIALAQGQDDTAARILEKVIERNPLNGEALMLLASYNERLGDPETAEFYYDRAIKVSDFRADALVQKARLKVSQSKLGEAVKLLEEAQAIKPRPNVANYLDAVRRAHRASL